MSLTADQIYRLNHMCPASNTANGTGLGTFLNDNIYGGGYRTGTKFYVDAQVSASGDGLTWDTAKKTIQEAITAANARIDWSQTPWLVDNYIFVAPGEYAEALTPAYSCHIIGYGVLGTDTAVEIHPASGKPLSGTGLGLHLYNLRFESTDTSDVLDFGVCNNTIIENCEIVCGVAGTSVNGISTENATHLRVLNCSFQFGGGSGGFTAGIYAGGGSNKYFHHCVVEGNIIQGIKTAGTGIYIADNCTASNAVITNNIIQVPGAGTGIYDGNGTSKVVCNKIIVGASGDCINHAGGNVYLLGNMNNVNGTVNYEPDFAND